MSAAHDRYGAQRRPEHSTIGDAHERRQRDPDAFTCGVQYALDRMVGHIDRILMDPHTAEYLTNLAADWLKEEHDRQEARR